MTLGRRDRHRPSPEKLQGSSQPRPCPGSTPGECHPRARIESRGLRAAGRTRLSAQVLGTEQAQPRPPLPHAHLLLPHQAACLQLWAAGRKRQVWTLPGAFSFEKISWKTP